MWWKAGVLVVMSLMSSVAADCDHDIEVMYVSTMNNNDICNGIYEHVTIDPKQCNDRDVFNHTDNGIYLLHVENSDNIGIGFWIMTTVHDCGTSYAALTVHVRAQDSEVNPGNINGAWDENDGTENYDRRTDIDVDCGATKPGVYMTVMVAVLAFWSIL